MDGRCVSWFLFVDYVCDDIREQDKGGSEVFFCEFLQLGNFGTPELFFLNHFRS